MISIIVNIIAILLLVIFCFMSLYYFAVIISHIVGIIHDRRKLKRLRAEIAEMQRLASMLQHEEEKTIPGLGNLGQKKDTRGFTLFELIIVLAFFAVGTIGFLAIRVLIRS